MILLIIYVIVVLYAMSFEHDAIEHTPDSCAVGGNHNVLQTSVCSVRYILKNDHAARFSSKGKTPWIELNGKAVPDSQLAIEFLKKKFGVDAESHLTKNEKAVARAFLKLTEENLYWYRIQLGVQLCKMYLLCI